MIESRELRQLLLLLLVLSEWLLAIVHRVMLLLPLLSQLLLLVNILPIVVLLQVRG